MKNVILTIVASLVIMTGFSSCKFLGDLFGEDTVLTTTTQLVEGAESTPVPYDQLPGTIKEKLPEGTELVMADKEDLRPEAAYLPVGGVGEGDAGGILDAVFALGATFIPGLAAWEGVLTLISRRKRQNYAKAIKALAPTDSKVDLGDGLKAVAAAIGASHSTEASKEVAEEEFKKVS